MTFEMSSLRGALVREAGGGRQGLEPSIFREAQPGIMGAPSGGKRWRPVSSAVLIKDV